MNTWYMNTALFFFWLISSSILIRRDFPDQLGRHHHLSYHRSCLSYGDPLHPRLQNLRVNNSESRPELNEVRLKNHTNPYDTLTRIMEESLLPATNSAKRVGDFSLLVTFHGSHLGLLQNSLNSLSALVVAT